MTEPKCSICTSPDRRVIDIALASGASYRSTAEAYKFSPSAMYRHRSNHLIPKASPEVERKAKQAEQRRQKQVENIWETRLESSFAEAQWGIERSKQPGESAWHAGARYLTAQAKIIEAGLRVTGAISDGSRTTINVGQMLIVPSAAPVMPVEITTRAQGLLDAPGEPDGVIDAEPCE